jgi:hypothetical protein
MTAQIRSARHLRARRFGVAFHILAALPGAQATVAATT